MLSVAVMSGGQGEYYVNLAGGDYYLEGGEPQGMWFGKGAEALGLSGTVQREDFLELFDGFLGGEALVQGAGKDRHRPGWDLTFSAPKSVSTAWSQADIETALEIQAAQASAVEKGVHYLEQQAAWTRRGKGGHEHQRCDLVVAAFEHGTSRAQDPQLHTHAIFLNVGVRQDGSTGTLETKALYDHKMAAGAIYRAELAHQLERRLGVEIQREGSWFEIAGVSKELSAEFSKRRKEIEASLAEKGLSTSKAAEVAALDTRRVKDQVPREELRQLWGAVGKEHQWGEEQLRSIMRGPQPARDAGQELQEAAATATDKMMEKRSFFAERDLVRALAEAAQTMRAGADQVLAKAQEFLAQAQDLVRLGLRFGEAIYSTKEMLAMERDLFRRAEESSKTAHTASKVTPDVLDWALGNRPTIKDEQAAALRHITQETGGIATVTGMAGTGKTFLLDAARSAWELSGCRVLGAALSGKAARGLQEGTQMESSTIASLTKRLEKGSLTLDEKTVLVVDEAGMVGTAQMHRLVTATQEAKSKLVLVGDEKQLQPIEAGGPFGALTKRLGTAHLSEIVRQREEWQRETVKEFAYGQASKALEEYAQRGFVSVAKDRDGARQELLEAWKEQGMRRPEENLIVTGTNLEATILNRTIQDLRAKEGLVKRDKSIEVGGELLCEGDRVLFTRNATAMGVDNGTLGTVEKVAGNSILSICIDGGQTRTLSAGTYPHLKLGYAFTTHKTQGMTAENVFVLTSETMQDRELSYVQASRPKGETRFFTTEAEAGDGLTALARTMARSRMKEMALDAADKEPGRDLGLQDEHSHEHSYGR
jgi:Ti-type conjugative transfer relaxase TraA